MRKLKRLVAKTNMRKKGFPHPCRKGKGGVSFFQTCWRDFVRV